MTLTSLEQELGDKFKDLSRKYKMPLSIISSAASFMATEIKALGKAYIIPVKAIEEYKTLKASWQAMEDERPRPRETSHLVDRIVLCGTIEESQKELERKEATEQREAQWREVMRWEEESRQMKYAERRYNEDYSVLRMCGGGHPRPLNLEEMDVLSQYDGGTTDAYDEFEETALMEDPKDSGDKVLPLDF